MKAFIDDLETRTEQNEDFRHVVFTGTRMQLVLMTLQPGEEIGEETHAGTDQFFRLEQGKGEVVMDGRTTRIAGDFGFVVPAGMRHNVRNTGHKPMRLYTIYAPPQHADGTIHHTKADAEKEIAHT
jgi:mannose-6-phosphate isomerase-like protein (cupin superfamily)